MLRDYWFPIVIYKDLMQEKKRGGERKGNEDIEKNRKRNN